MAISLSALVGQAQVSTAEVQEQNCLVVADELEVWSVESGGEGQVVHTKMLLWYLRVEVMVLCERTSVFALRILGRGEVDAIRVVSRTFRGVFVERNELRGEVCRRERSVLKSVR